MNIIIDLSESIAHSDLPPSVTEELYLDIISAASDSLTDDVFADFDYEYYIKKATENLTEEEELARPGLRAGQIAQQLENAQNDVYDDVDAQLQEGCKITLFDIAPVRPKWIAKGIMLLEQI